MRISLTGKIVLITGGSSGIGLAAAKVLAARGAHIWLTARDPEKLRTAALAVASARANTSQRVCFHPADVSDPKQVTRLFEEITRDDGTPDIVINSAGVVQPGYVQHLDSNLFRWMMDINYFGTVYITKAFLPGMMERRSGHVVNISSMAGFLGTFGYSAYGASKYAVRGFSDALRAEMKPHGISVSIVFPPDTDTPQLTFDNLHKPQETKALAGNVHVMQPETVAEEIVKGIERKKYIILPGLENKVIYRLSSLVGNGIYPIMDFLIARTKKNEKITDLKTG